MSINTIQYWYWLILYTYIYIYTYYIHEYWVTGSNSLSLSLSLCPNAWLHQKPWMILHATRTAEVCRWATFWTWRLLAIGYSSNFSCLIFSGLQVAHAQDLELSLTPPGEPPGTAGASAAIRCGDAERPRWPAMHHTPSPPTPRMGSLLLQKQQ